MCPLFSFFFLPKIGERNRVQRSGMQHLMAQVERIEDVIIGKTAHILDQNVKFLIAFILQIICFFVFCFICLKMLEISIFILKNILRVSGLVSFLVVVQIWSLCFASRPDGRFCSPK